MQLSIDAWVNNNTLWNWKANVLQGVNACEQRKRWALNDFSILKPGLTPSDEQLSKQILVKYNGITSSTYYTLSTDSTSFIRPTYLCADCGSCGPRREHYKNEDHPECLSTNPCEFSIRCYADGAYSCSH